MYFINDTRIDPLEGIRLPPQCTEDEYIARDIARERADAHGGCLYCSARIIQGRCECAEFQERRAHDRAIN